MVCLDLELLTGAYRASLPDQSGGEWPPHPERVFSALVQAWGDGGRQEAERAALQWLEALPPPEIEASGPKDVASREAPKVFVPPNDPAGTDLVVLPDRRRRQERTFQATIPASPIVRYRWGVEEPEPEIRASLQALAHRVASVGHSSSLVRCAFSDAASQPDDAVWRPSPTGHLAVRAPYAGRLADLERWLSTEDGKVAERPRTRRTERYEPPGEPKVADTPTSVFGGRGDWFIFEDANGAGDRDALLPDILAFPHIAKRVRDALMSLADQPPPETISGHGSGGGPSERPHLAVLPLMNVGWQHASGELMGLAVCLPRGLDDAERRATLRALGRFVSVDESGSRAQVNLFGAKKWFLERTAAPERESLHPGRFCRASTSWASVTPVLLDRFPSRGNVFEEAEIVAAACRNIGLPEPVEIELHKHSAWSAAPSAYPARGDRRRPDWSFPRGSALQSRVRRHVVLRFAERVEGPIVIGAGRYQGLGLCLPVPEGDWS